MKGEEKEEADRVASVDVEEAGKVTHFNNTDK